MRIPTITRQELSWILYDVGNSAFVLVMITTVMPLYFKDVAAHNLPEATSTAYWGYANSLAALLLALMALPLGALGDIRDNKKRVFLALVLLGIIFTLLLATPQSEQWLTCLCYFVLARVGWAGANILYDAFLVDVAAAKRMDQISAYGFGWGYIGSVVPFLAVIALILGAGESGNQAIPAHAARTGFLVVAVWWSLFTLPLWRNVQQHHGVAASRQPLRNSLRRLRETLRDIRGQRPVFLFLLAYFCYIDGVDTIITMATAYGRELQFNTNLLIAVVLFIQVIAFPFALLYGRLSKQFHTRNILLCGIGIYGFITLVAFLIPSVPGHDVKVALFWSLAFLVGSSMGGIQALSRSYFAKLIPAHKSGEFFGLYNVVGKFSAILGPFMVGLIGTLTGHSRWGVLSILLLFVIGAWLLRRMPYHTHPIFRHR